jgi:hypothetical protein
MRRVCLSSVERGLGVMRSGLGSRVERMEVNPDQVV